MLSNDTGNSLESSHVSSAASTNTTVLGGGVDGDEDNVGLADVLGNVGGEEQVGLALSNGDLAIVSSRALVVGSRLIGDGGSTATVTGDTDDIVQTGLVDGRVLGVPAADASDVSVNDGDLDVGVLESDDSGGGTTWEFG